LPRAVRAKSVRAFIHRLAYSSKVSLLGPGSIQAPPVISACLMLSHAAASALVRNVLSALYHVPL
jgi:hypothetical protein